MNLDSSAAFGAAHLLGVVSVKLDNAVLSHGLLLPLATHRIVNGQCLGGVLVWLAKHLNLGRYAKHAASDFPSEVSSLIRVAGVRVPVGFVDNQSPLSQPNQHT